MGVWKISTLLHIFCPIYGEFTLQCQNKTFMNESDVGELRVQSHEIDMHTI